MTLRADFVSPPLPLHFTEHDPHLLERSRPHRQLLELAHVRDRVFARTIDEVATERHRVGSSELPNHVPDLVRLPIDEVTPALIGRALPRHNSTLRREHVSASELAVHPTPRARELFELPLKALHLVPLEGRQHRIIVDHASHLLHELLPGLEGQERVRHPLERRADDDVEVVVSLAAVMQFEMITRLHKRPWSFRPRRGDSRDYHSFVKKMNSLE